MTALIRHIHGSTVRFDQCRYGASARKPTMIVSNDPAIASLAACCDHGNAHAPAIGLRPGGGFVTTPLA
eukprot:9898582-Lingulodinium_polyedra.AAC.1